jgi:hypothetical protein
MALLGAIPSLVTLAINMLTIQCPRIHSRQAVDVYCNRLRPIGHVTVGETLNTADIAEKVADHFIVKEVLGKFIFSGFQLELLNGCKRQYKTHALAARTVTSDGAL